MRLMKEAYNELINNPTFLEWGGDNEASYLCGCYNSRDGVNDDVWNFDFYNKNDTITTFQVSVEIKKNENQEIFKEDSIKLNEINLDEVEVELDSAIVNAKKSHKEEFSKTIAILQKSKELQWNITMISADFNVLNVRIDAISGNELHRNFGSVLDFKKK
jgi:hypothetical protein